MGDLASTRSRWHSSEKLTNNSDRLPGKLTIGNYAVIYPITMANLTYLTATTLQLCCVPSSCIIKCLIMLFKVLSLSLHPNLEQ